MTARWVAFALFIAALAVTGGVMGARYARLDPQTAIAPFVAQYLSESTEHRESDCASTLARGRAWLVLRCGEQVYLIDRFGRALPQIGGDL